MDFSSDKEFYDQVEEIDLTQHQKWMSEIKFYFDSYATELNNTLKGTSGKVIELGAESCSLSLNLSKLKHVQKVYSLDISTKRMTHMINISNKFIDGDINKIELIEHDFNLKLPFMINEIDAIFFDASLHHSRSLWNLLSECHRVLKPNGLLIAQRESFLNSYRAKTQLAKLLQSPEFSAKVSENMYLKEQYEYYLNINDFNVTFLPVSPNKIKKLFKILNGILFCDGVLYCIKK